MPYFDLTGEPVLAHWANSPTPYSATQGAINIRSMSVARLDNGGGAWPQLMTASSMIFALSLSYTTSVSQAFSSTVRLGIYTRTGSTLSLLNSASKTFGTTSANTSNRDAFHGPRLLDVESAAWSVQPVFRRGVEYWLAWVFDSNVTNGPATVLMAAATNLVNSGRVGQNSSLATGTQLHPWDPFRGVYTATTTGMPASIVETQIQAGTAVASAPTPWVRIDGSGLFP